MLYFQLTPVNLDTDILTSDYMWLPILASFGFTDSFKSVSWVTFAMATLPVSWGTYWYLHCCCVPVSDVFDEVSVISLDLDSLSAG